MSKDVFDKGSSKYYDQSGKTHWVQWDEDVVYDEEDYEIHGTFLEFFTTEGEYGKNVFMKLQGGEDCEYIVRYENDDEEKVREEKDLEGKTIAIPVHHAVPKRQVQEYNFQRGDSVGIRYHGQDPSDDSHKVEIITDAEEATGSNGGPSENGNEVVDDEEEIDEEDVPF